jgi:hypothetical protein
MKEANKYPLYPELSEDGNKEAQELMDKFKVKAKKVLDELLDDYLGTVYCNLLPSIESDSWINYRNTMMEGFKNYDNRLIQNKYDFKEIRQQIYKQFKTEIDKDLDQDNLDRIKELEDQLKFMRELEYRRF